MIPKLALLRFTGNGTIGAQRTLDAPPRPAQSALDVGGQKSMLGSGLCGKAHCVVFGVLATLAVFSLPPRSLAVVPLAPPVIHSITVVKKPGEADGRAMATVNGKTGSIAAHVVQAWTIQQGRGALLLLSPLKKNLAYRVRYYELDAREGRSLGEVPFAQANMLESTTGAWAFTVSGVDPASKDPSHLCRRHRSDSRAYRPCVRTGLLFRVTLLPDSQGRADHGSAHGSGVGYRGHNPFSLVCGREGLLFRVSSPTETR